MNYTRRRRAVSAVRASLFTRLRNRLFRRRRHTISPAMSAYLSMERRRATIEPEMDICDQPTEPLLSVDPAAMTVAVPAEPLWFYVDETAAVPTR